MHVDSFFGVRFCLGLILTVTNYIYEAFCPFFFSCNLSLAKSFTSIKLWNKKNKVIEVCAAMFYAHLNLWSMFPGTVDNTFKRQRLVNAYFFVCLSRVREFCCILGQLFDFLGKRREPDKQNRYIRQNKTSSEMWEDIVKDINYSFSELQESFNSQLAMKHLTVWAKMGSSLFK